MIAQKNRTNQNHYKRYKKRDKLKNFLVIQEITPECDWKKH